MKRLKNIYSHIAITFFTVVLLFVLINVASYYILKQKERADAEGRLREIHELLPQIINYEAIKSSFADKDSTYIHTHIHEVADDFMRFSIRDTAFQYYPAAEYMDAPFTSKHITLTAKEIIHRITVAENITEPKNFEKAVYCFGGSTTFGSLVSNAHTWPSYLMALMNNDSATTVTKVVNYGISGYSVTQETLLFINLLKLGHRPSAAVFMDGVNTGPTYDASEYSLGIAERFNDRGFTSDELPGFISLLPVIQLINNSYYKLDRLESDESTGFPFEISSDYNNKIAQRFIVNAAIRATIGKMYGVKVVQFLQPNVFVNYNVQLLTDMQREKIDTLQQKNFRKLYELVNAANAGFTDLSSLFDSYGKTPALVDGLHYSPAFNKALAEKVYNYINTDSLPDYKYDSAGATGVPYPFLY